MIRLSGIIAFFFTTKLICSAQVNEFYKYEHGYDKHRYVYAPNSQIRTLRRYIYDVDIIKSGNTTFDNRRIEDHMWDYNYIPDAKIEFDRFGNKVSEARYFYAVDSVSYDTFCYDSIRPEIPEGMKLNENQASSYYFYWNNTLLYSERVSPQVFYFIHDATSWNNEFYQKVTLSENELHLQYQLYDSIDLNYDNKTVDLFITFENGVSNCLWNSYDALPDSTRVRTTKEIGGDNLHEKMDYDEKGNLIEYWFKSDIESERFEFYTYDKFNNQTSMHVYDSSLIWICGETSEYNKNGKLIESRRLYNENYDLTLNDSFLCQPFVLKVERNNDDSVVRFAYQKDWYDTVLYESLFGYDELGRLSSKSFYKSGKLESEVLYQYNEDGQLATKKFYWQNPYLKCYEPYREKHFEYDEHGNLVAQYNKKIGLKSRELVLTEIIKYQIDYYD